MVGEAQKYSGKHEITGKRRNAQGGSETFREAQKRLGRLRNAEISEMLRERQKSFRKSRNVQECSEMLSDTQKRLGRVRNVQ